MDDHELQELADRLRRGREKIEKALTETLTGRTEDLVKRITELRERMESRTGEKHNGSH
jgi:chaperonin cofactor prefoldin